ncbi:hypothetical protein FKM82_006541 [Ascaphus truei]
MSPTPQTQSQRPKAPEGTTPPHVKNPQGYFCSPPMFSPVHPHWSTPKCTQLGTTKTLVGIRSRNPKNHHGAPPNNKLPPANTRARNFKSTYG